MDRSALRRIVLDDCPLDLAAADEAKREETLEILVDAILTDAPSLPAPAPASEAAPGRSLPASHPRLIGLRGAPRAGKDVVAASFASNYIGVRRIAFSEPIIAELNAFLMPFFHVIVEENKSHLPYRRALQQWATMRKLEDAEYWAGQVKKMVQNIWAEGAQLVVATGVRDLSDVGAIRDLGGEIWHVQRPGMVADLSHPRERLLEGIEGIDDVMLENPSEGDVGPLCAAAEQALSAPR